MPSQDIPEHRQPLSPAGRVVTLLALMLVTFVLGSVHAFSVFVVPLEGLLSLPRSEISLFYSFALVGITVAVLMGYRVYALLPSWRLLLVTCLVATAGLLLASRASSWWQFFLGYSVAFGLSNGVGYGFCLQLAGRALVGIKGFAMGAVTATYAVGSIVFARLFAWRIELDSLESALVMIAISVTAVGLIAAILLRLTGVAYGQSTAAADPDKGVVDRNKILRFWIAYMTSVFAGLMAIGHAAGIALSKNATTELATLAAVTIGIGSALGGFLAGWLVDRWPVKRFLVGLPLLSAVSLLAISASGSASLVVVLLSLVGLAYGSIIAIYPVAISDCFGEQGPRAYGQVFIAWGFAGLVAPWCAGLVYDLSNGYGLALLLAAAMAMASALSAKLFNLGQSA